MQLSQAFDQHVQQRASIKVVSMDFIEDYHLAGEAKLANEKMLGRNDPKQGLVNGADSVGRKKRPLGGGEP